MMSAAATEVCKRVVAKIGKFTVKGIGKDETVWEATTPTHDIFWDALIKWDTEATDENKKALVAAAEDWIGAWREASVEYQARRMDETNQGD
jgi:hypothetical protein